MYLKVSGLSGLTFVFLSSAVVSSNSSPSLKETSVFLKVLSVLMVITSPLMLIVTLGLATPAIFLVANPTPVSKIGPYEIFIFPQSFSLMCWKKSPQCFFPYCFLSSINSMLQIFFYKISLGTAVGPPSHGWVDVRKFSILSLPK